MAPGKKKKPTATELVKEIKRRTRRVFSSEEKIKIVLEGLRGEESIEDLSIHIGLSNSDVTKALIKKLKDNGIFYEIWNYSYGYDFQTKDTLSVELELNQQGMYVQLLELLGENNDFFLEYDKHIQSSGTISPRNIAQFMKYFREVEFQKEVNRLVFAVHYITIVSDEEYEK